MKMAAPTIGEDHVERIGEALLVCDPHGVFGARVAVREPPLEQVRQSARQERDRPQAGDQPPLQRRPEPSFREREQQVDEGRQEQASEQSDEPDHPTVVALIETGGRPQRADEDHQPARAVVGLLGPGDQAADHERERDDREDDGDRGVVESCRPVAETYVQTAITPSRTGKRPSQSRMARFISPCRSALRRPGPRARSSGTKPQAPLASTSVPKSPAVAARDEDDRRTASRSRVSRRVTSKPVDVGELHVEQHDVRVQAACGRNRATRRPRPRR